MMKKIKFTFAGFLFLFSATLFSQQVNTLYFLDNVPYQSYLNPSFQPERDGYIGLPVLGYGQLSVTNNSFSIKNFVYKKNGKLVTFLHPELGDKDKFYNRIKKNTAFNLDYQINLLSFGFRFKEKNYFSFGITERIDGNVVLSKDIFKLLLYGTPERTGNTFDLKSLSFASSVYTEFGLGFSRKESDKMLMGFRLKFLLGSGNFSFSSKNLNLIAGVDKWQIKGLSTLNASLPVKVKDDFSGIETPSNFLNYIKPSGYGAAVDLGITYYILKSLKFSAALTDLGFIYWNNNVKSVSADIDYSFKGIELKGAEMFNNFNTGGVIDSLKKGLMNSFHLSNNKSKNFYLTMPTAKLNIGFEYTFYKDKLGVGLLSRTMYLNKRFYQEITASFNVRPVNWFNMSLSYSILNGRSTIGAGMGIHAGPIHFFFATDYIPVSYTSYKNNPVPYHSSGVNLAGGIVFVWGKRDKDKDGVPNKFDLCPGTPKGVLVDSVGCPLDTDGDGVPDYLDLCPFTPAEAYHSIDSVGCPIDTDGDSVPDYLDKCPDTPAEAYLLIDSIGCPLDSDGDGVPDYLDKCPETPLAAVGFVDSVGCLLDSDGDGVPDYLDKCLNTPEKVIVDSVGCPLDSDRDGVPDYLDKCPSTPAEACSLIDSVGCPLDSDGDGIPDYLDSCPKIAGPSSNKGCPEVKQEVKRLFTKALQGIQFASGKDVLLKESYPILDQVVAVLVENPDYLLDIVGHTDNVGDPVKNLELSGWRANSVRYYLMKKGVSENRLTASGKGDTVPVATNKTAAGRKQNRRVELTVRFQTITLETVTQTPSPE